MGKFTPVTSDFTFTEGIRVFKANDPYYWEVDNIPVKQLAENTLWLKDQLSADSVTKVNREDFEELRPYVNGDDRILRVRPGRYSARINDAFELTPLQRFVQATGQGLGEVDSWKVFASDDVLLQTVLVQFQSMIAANALNMNGLVERAFTYPVKDSDFAATTFLKPNEPTTQNVNGVDKPIFPLSEVLLWIDGRNKTDYEAHTFNVGQKGEGFLQLSRAENELTKRWRGVTRTAIVDVPDELQITVPTFDANDFFYTDASGIKQLLPATLRVDLAFIYSKPVDTSSTTIAKYQSKIPQSITKAELGLFRGAGLGLNFKDAETSIDVNHAPQDGIDDEGISRMLANPSDELDTNNGFSGLSVHGSFPSPDDLMNLAPLLSYKLEDDSYALIGQSILPVAYIITTTGVANIPVTSIIDIRPFFRTTELAFNERAGIAAALPSLSFANPAVGKAQLDYETKRIYDDLSGRLNSLEGGKGVTAPRAVTTGYIFGGINFGVEGAFKDYLDQSHGVGNLTKAELIQTLKNRRGFPNDISIPDFPDWDLSNWVEQQNISEKGLHANDYINHVAKNARTNTSQVDFGSFADSKLSTTLSKFGTDQLEKDGGGFINLLFCKKTINIDRSQVTWMDDFIVIANFYECVPLSSRGSAFQQNMAAGSASIWVEKKPDQFTIYCSWVANDYFRERSSTLAGTDGKIFPQNNRDGNFAGFAVMNQEIMNTANKKPNYVGESSVGVATYPSVMFQVIGIPAGFTSHAVPLNTKGATIKLT